MFLSKKRKYKVLYARSTGLTAPATNHLPHVAYHTHLRKALYLSSSDAQHVSAGAHIRPGKALLGHQGGL